MSGAVADRLTFHRNPLRMFFSPAPWAATAYLLSYIPFGTTLFATTVAVVATSTALSASWLCFPLLVGAAGIVRGAAEVERQRARLVSAPIEASYRPVTGRGVLAQLKTRWRDRATIRNVLYLVAMYPPLLLLDTVLVALWLLGLGMITIPAWFWALPQTWPNGDTGNGLMIGLRPAGLDGTGGVWIGDVPTALLFAFIGFEFALLAGYGVVAGARLHRHLARWFLGTPRDPLAPALRILAEPGPLGR